MRMHKRIKSIDQYSRGKMKKNLSPHHFSLVEYSLSRVHVLVELKPLKVVTYTTDRHYVVGTYGVSQRICQDVHFWF